MNKKYFNQLNHDTRLLVQEIEHDIRAEINVNIDASRTDVLACEVGKQGATILVHREDYFPDDSVLHELLHIRRVCLNKVPRIVVCESYENWNPKLETALTKLDNNLEHFVIVPEEIKCRPNRKEYWELRIYNALEKFDSLSLIRDDQERKALIYKALIHNIVPERELIKKIDVVLSGLGIRKRASLFLDSISPYIDIKDKLVKVCFEHLQIPEDAGCLKYIDCKNNSCYEESLGSVIL